MENTRNPWLDIPLADYERHMALPEIGQAPMLADELEFAVRQHFPKSLALIGCSGGNGLNRLVGGFVERIVGIDINPAYVETVRSRFGAQIPGLELHIADIQFAPPKLAPVDLLFAALILEYVDLRLTMGDLRRLCTPGGILVVILQAPSSDMEAVSASPYKSIQLLAPNVTPTRPGKRASGSGRCGLFAVIVPHRRAAIWKAVCGSIFCSSGRRRLNR